MANQIDSLLAQLYYENKPRVKADTVALCTQFKSLVPKVSTLIHNDGMETQNLMFGGTIPIFFQGVQYNIPVDIYISSRHPLAAPKVFVRPTSNMIVKPGHQCVDMDGTVCFQYLSQWQNTSGSSGASLVEMVQIMSVSFSQEPPLFTRPKVTNSNNSSMSSSASSSGYSSGNVNGYNNTAAATAVTNGYSYNGINNFNNNNNNNNTPSTAYAYAETFNTTNDNNNSTIPAAAVTLVNNNNNNNIVTATYVTPNNNNNNNIPILNGTVVGGKNNNTTSSSSMNSSNHSSNSSFNNNNINNNSLNNNDTKNSSSARYLQLQHDVTLKLQRELFEVHSKLKTEIDDEFYTQALLQSSYDSTIQKQKILNQLKTDVSESLKEIEKKSQLLQEWTALQQQEKIKNQVNEETDTAGKLVEKYIDAHDGASNQLVRLYAEQKTYSDIIYYLEKAKQHSNNNNGSNNNGSNNNKNDSLDTVSFLKQIRMYAKKEFLCRMHIMKINQTISSSFPSSSSSSPQVYQQQQYQSLQQQQSTTMMMSNNSTNNLPNRTITSSNSFNTNINHNDNNNNNNAYSNFNALAAAVGNNGVLYNNYNSDHYNINSLPVAPAPQKPIRRKE